MAGQEQEQEEVTLLDFWVSPFVQRCRIALAEKGVAYTSVEQDLRNKGELLLRSNPVHKKVPVLLHAGRPVCESLVILAYLDEAWPETPQLLPPAGDPHARAHARFWADYVDTKLFDAQTRLWKLGAGGRAQAAKDLVEALETLDAELGDKPFLAGDAFGFLDVALVPFTSWFLAYERLGGFAAADHCPRLLAWAARCKQRDSVATALSDPEKVFDFVLYLKDTYGVQ